MYCLEKKVFPFPLLQDMFHLQQFLVSYNAARFSSECRNKSCFLFSIQQVYPEYLLLNNPSLTIALKLYICAYTYMYMNMGLFWILLFSTKVIVCSSANTVNILAVTFYGVLHDIWWVNFSFITVFSKNIMAILECCAL